MASVLIVDDDPFIGKLVSRTLQDVAGCEAPDGAEALELARSEPPALVFHDLDMPGIDGSEVCRLREDPETAQTTIVVLTASADEGAERAAEDAGADLFLAKPFSRLELPRLVHDLGDGGSG